MDGEVGLKAEMVSWGDGAIEEHGPSRPGIVSSAEAC